MDQIQFANNTFLFREINLLRSAKVLFARNGLNRPLKILSFGCSVGDEIASMRWVFPDADIVGCDIDPAVTDAAARSVGHLAAIIRSDEHELSARGPYDLILACSVLCLNPQPRDFFSRFPPSKFDETLSFLDGILRSGGLLAITNASYRFLDSPVAAGYQPVRSDVVSSSGFVDVMDRRGSPLLVGMQAASSRYFRRSAHFVPGEDEELADSLFHKTGDRSPEAPWVIVSPPPKDFVRIAEFERRNTDGVADPVNALQVTTRFRFGRDASTGFNGFLKQVRWDSLVRPGHEHVRQETWHPQEVPYP